MKLKDLKTKDVFTIENTPSYPKLKLDNGYVDMRDDIINTSGNCDEREVRILEPEELSKIFDSSISDVEDWIWGKIIKYKELK